MPKPAIGIGTRLYSITPEYARKHKNLVKMHRATMVLSLGGAAALSIAQTTLLGFEPDDVQNVLLLLLPASLLGHSAYAYVLAKAASAKAKPVPPAALQITAGADVPSAPPAGGAQTDDTVAATPPAPPEAHDSQQKTQVVAGLLKVGGRLRMWGAGIAQKIREIKAPVEDVEDFEIEKKIENKRQSLSKAEVLQSRVREKLEARETAEAYDLCTELENVAYDLSAGFKKNELRIFINLAIQQIAETRENFNRNMHMIINKHGSSEELRAAAEIVKQTFPLSQEREVMAELAVIIDEKTAEVNFKTAMERIEALAYSARLVVRSAEEAASGLAELSGAVVIDVNSLSLRFFELNLTQEQKVLYDKLEDRHEDLEGRLFAALRLAGILRPDGSEVGENETLATTITDEDVLKGFYLKLIRIVLEADESKLRAVSENIRDCVLGVFANILENDPDRTDIEKAGARLGDIKVPTS